MHHSHPIITYLRAAGFVIGATLFVIMAYRSGQSVNDPAATRGTRNQQTYVSFNTQGSLPATADESYTTTAAVAVPQATPPTGQQPSPRVNDTTASAAAATPNDASNSKTANGKALGIQKHQD